MACCLYVNGTLSEIVFDGNVAGSRSLSTARNIRVVTLQNMFEIPKRCVFRLVRNNNSNGCGNRNNNKDSKATSKKKTLEDYYFYVGSAKQASNYESAADFIINHIKKEYERG
jgi:hypothetical protein